MNNSKIEKQPVAKIEWIHRDDLYANDYNPNVVAPPEHDLLETSLLEDGWTQPIVKRWDPDKNRWEIVDGFNRWLMSGRPRVYAMTDGYVPTTTIVPQNRESQMMATVRHNRAMGTHTVVKMADIVQALIEANISVPEIMHRLQMEREEVLRLAAKNGIPKSKIIDQTEFSKAWKPQ